METRVQATELARSLSDVLNRVRYKGERFVIERNGQPVAHLGPVEQQSEPTLGDLMKILERFPPLDEDFAADVEAVQSSQPKIGLPPWD